MGLVAAITVFFAGTGAQAAGTPQTLGIVMKRNSASTERLPFYRNASPIAVRVRGAAKQLSGMSVVARGPDGRAVSTPLVRSGDTFNGALNLAAPGTWTLAFTSQLGTASAALSNIPVVVVADDNADLAARIAYALSALSIGAGLTLLVRARRLPARFPA
jgi:hypothetical protein